MAVPKDVYDWLKGLSKASASAFAAWRGASTGPIVECVVGPSDMLFIPAGWSYVDRVGKSVDLVGIRVQALYQMDLETLEPLAKYLDEIKKPNIALRTLVDSLILSKTIE
jgi:hypothetical protein